MLGLQRWMILVAGIILILSSAIRTLESEQPPLHVLHNVSLDRFPAELSPPAGFALATKPIQGLCVGERVPAINPETDEQERSNYVEPDWSQYLKLQLEMPKPDGRLLKMELLRSEQWLDHQLEFIIPSDIDTVHLVQSETAYRLPSSSFVERHVMEADEPNEDADSTILPASPLRRIFLDLHLLAAAAAKDSLNLVPIVLMDLPELGLTGPAFLLGVEPAPEIPQGPGRVVTATFHHSSGDVIDLKFGPANSTVASKSPVAAEEDESIGTTANHPFWSVDRKGFIQAGQLQIGEELITFSGEKKRVVSLLPRPGPTAVFNIEVDDQHVYYVGNGGVLVHNSAEYGLTIKKITNAHYGREAELRAIQEMEQAGFEHLDGLRLRGDTGFDGIFIKRASDGSFLEIAVVESKMTFTGTPSFNTITGGIKQMSNAWVDDVIKRMRSTKSNPHDEYARWIGDQLFHYRSIIDRRVNVTFSNGVNLWDFLNLPD